jgi:hypothetical protein
MKHRRDNQERKIQRYRQYGHKKQNKDIKQTQHRKQQKDEQHRPHQKYTMSNPRKVLSVTEERIYKNGKDPFSCEKRLLPQQCNLVSGNIINYIQSNFPMRSPLLSSHLYKMFTFFLYCHRKFKI